MKMPCELIVTHILPTARGALARDLVTSHGMTQTQVAKLFGVTSAAVSQYLKGMRGGNNLIDRSAYKDDFYAEKVYPGSLHYISGVYGHRLINTGDTVLAVAACSLPATKQDHAVVEAKVFPYRCFKRDGKIVWEEA